MVVVRTMLPDKVVRRRTDALQEVIRAELENRRHSLDGDNAIRSVTITVKMVQGTAQARAVIVQVESENTLAR